MAATVIMQSLLTVAVPAVAMESKTVLDQIHEYKPQKKLKTDLSIKRTSPMDLILGPEPVKKK